MTKVIAVVNQKGGVGKTATVQNLGAALALKGKKILLIDADPQFSLTSCLLAEEPEEDQTLTAIFKAMFRCKPVPTVTLSDEAEGIDLIPSSLSLTSAEMELLNQMGRDTYLKTFVNGIKSEYDYVLIDTNPSLGMITLNALVAADQLIIPVEPEYKPYKGMDLLFNTIEQVRQKDLNPNLEVLGILFTMVRSVQDQQDTIKKIRTECKYRCFESEIPFSNVESKSNIQLRSVVAAFKYSGVAKAYKQLADEILAINEPE